MDIQSEKIELIKRLLNTDDELILQQVKDIFETREKDFLDDLPDYVKVGIEKGLKQADAGQYTPHDVVIKKYEKYI